MRYSMRAPSLAAIAVVFFLFLSPHAARAAAITVTMTDNQFAPQRVTVNPGDTVTWINQGSTAHTVTADSGSFDSGTMQPQQQFSATFNAPGTYAYHCKFHGSAGGAGMAGTIVVAGAAAAAAAQTYSNSNANYYAPANTASASAQSRLQTQAQALLFEIQALEAQLGGGAAAGSAGPSTYSASCPLLGRSLKRGASGDDVSRLQQFLARDPSIYPEGLVTGYFGALTEAAVQRWQAKYNIVSSGTPDTTGYGVVGPRTAAAISIICSGGSLNGVPAPAPASPTVGGFITVTPVSGAAPLAVAVTATVNTVGSCSGATYTLSFGDSTNPVAIPVAAGNCGQAVETFQHLYQYGGNYTLTLSAGSHSTTATVSVSGTTPLPPPNFTPGLPKESFTATPSSGPVPLAVTFSGVVNSNDAGFCNGGCADTLDYGDGTIANVQLPATAGGWLNYSLTHTYAQQGGFRATLFQGGEGASQPAVGSATIVVGPLAAAPSTPTPTTPAPAPAPAPPPAPSYYYYPPSVTSAGSGSLSFTAKFDLPSSCTGYDVSWGDGSADATQQDGGSSCAQNPATKTLSHAYAAGGSYTIVVKRGPTLSQVDDIAITIAN